MPGGKTAELLVRLALEAGTPVRADRLLDDLWAGAATQPQHAAVEGRAAAARARRPARSIGGDGGYRLAVEPGRRSTRCACCATRRPRRGGSTRATTTAPRELSAAALARFRGELLPAAGDWAAPHRARLEEARAQLLETQLAARLRLGERRRSPSSRPPSRPTRTRSGCGSC